MSISRKSHYYEPKKSAEDQVIKAYLLQLAEQHKRWGFDKMMQKIKLDQKPWNHKRVRRLYCELGLNIRIKPRKRIPKGEAKVILQPLKPNLCWSIDFMSDALSCGRKFRTLNVIDDYNREGLMIEPSHSLPAKRVTNLLDQLAAEKGYPDMIRVDNGPEFVSSTFREWAKRKGVLLHFIQPGKPAQNGLIERFNRTYREDILDMNLFSNLMEVKFITKNWLSSYNQDRPHESLGGQTPFGFAAKRETSRRISERENSTFKL